MAKKITALVLAAGASERMTEPKMLLPFGDRTILNATLEAVLGSGVCDETVVVLGANAADLRPTLDASRVRIATNPDPAAGLSSSLRTGVEAAGETDAYMVLLGDHPLLAAPTVSRLAEKFRSGGKGICVPVFQGVPGHPVFFDRSYRDALLSLTGDEGARRILMAHPADVLDVHVAEIGVVFDVDDEEDYDEALRLAGLPPRVIPEEEPEEAEMDAAAVTSREEAHASVAAPQSPAAAHETGGTSAPGEFPGEGGGAAGEDGAGENGSGPEVA